MDEESKVFLDRVLEPAMSGEPQRNLGQQDNVPDDSPCGDHRPVPIASTSNDTSAIAPFASPEQEPRSRGSHSPVPSINPNSLSRSNSFLRPPIFGPERVVQDPLIKAVHQQVMNDILHVGFWFTLVSFVF